MKTEPKGLRKAIHELAQHYYGSNQEVFELPKAKTSPLYLIFMALELVKGEDYKTLERAFPARAEALKRFKEHMATDPKQIVDEFFFKWGFMYDFERMKVVDLEKEKINVQIEILRVKPI